MPSILTIQLAQDIATGETDRAAHPEPVDT
jgi:hypothetical protein